MHASGMARHVQAYEFSSPEQWGNERVIVGSKQSGLSNVRALVEKSAVLTSEQRRKVLEDSSVQQKILAELKRRESAGFSYELAPASLELLMLRCVGEYPRNVVELAPPNVQDTLGKHSSATIKVQVNGDIEAHHEVADSEHGVIQALWLALQKATHNSYPCLADLQLADFQVHKDPTSDEGAGSVVQVHIDFSFQGTSFRTTSSAPDMLRACWDALHDGVDYVLLLRPVRA